MSMNNIIEGLFTNIGMAFPEGLLVVTIICSLPFFAAGAKIGLITNFVLIALEYVMLSIWGYSTTTHLVALFVCLILMAFSLLTSSQGSKVI
jgi:hypothetical protein